MDDEVRSDPVSVRSTTPSEELHARFGNIDIYLFDQILRGRFDRRRILLDAGCGDGRNLVYFLSRGFECFAADHDPPAVESVRRLAARLAPALPAANFQCAELDGLPFSDSQMEAVIASAVLHFASDEPHFTRMVDDLWRVLAPGGLFFARLASNIGLETSIGPARRRVRLPDGSERFIVDEDMLVQFTDRLRGRLLDPIKTTIVQGARCMTTWCMAKHL